MPGCNKKLDKRDAIGLRLCGSRPRTLILRQHAPLAFVNLTRRRPLLTLTHCGGAPSYGVQRKWGAYPKKLPAHRAARGAQARAEFILQRSVE
ncbi:hypothetical protein EVAR_52852_1 [Eumeta japonica]|uniref:Uncharacterized protein n=1 Tax=Eumeta variegata TaxID=151549 RepID=A0A4C1YB73_EUMVA|nr:hypothetical protein EVAR_52852_1 [Eumeta japonica]